MNEFTKISIPALNLEFNPDRSFEIGPLTIHIYGVLIALGLMLAIIYAWKRCSQFGIQEDDLTDGILWILPFAVICARAYYCVFQWSEFKADPISVLFIWEGGIAIYGSVIGAAIGVVIHSRVKGIKIPALLDLVALGFLIGQCIGRWGNFINREAFGEATDSFLRMGLFNRNTMQWEYYHPTFFYESMWNLAGFVLLHFLSKKRKYDGQIALGYVAWYGLGRTAIEGLRMDSLYWGPFRISQMLAAVSCVAAVLVLIIMAFLHHDAQNLLVNQLAAEKEEEPEEEFEEEEIEENAPEEEGIEEETEEDESEEEPEEEEPEEEEDSDDEEETDETDEDVNE